MRLPGPDADYTLKISFPLVAEMEKEQGGLHAIAGRLLDNTLPVTGMIGLLKILYRASGCEVTDEFLLQQPCAELLAEALFEILNPLESEKHENTGL